MRNHHQIRCTALLLCDDVIHDPATDKVHLIGCFNAVRHDEFPARSQKLCVYAVITGWRGLIRLAVLCVEARTELDVFATPLHTVQLQKADDIYRGIFRIDGCTFPRAGDYRIQCFGNEFLLAEIRLVLRQQLEH